MMLKIAYTLFESLMFSFLGVWIVYFVLSPLLAFDIPPKYLFLFAAVFTLAISFCRFWSRSNREGWRDLP